MSQIEREIKILNVDVNHVKSVLKKKGIEPRFKYIQDVYTFDLEEIDKLYEKYVLLLIEQNDNREILKLVNEVKPCFSKKDILTINSVLNKEIIEFIMDTNSDYSLLLSKSIKEIILKAKDNFSKWIRLRKTGDDTTITIKKIVNSSGEYELDAVKELEINVPDIDTGLELLSDLGYFFARHQKKMRLAYDYKNTEIVIDKWPMLPPYIEVEGPSKDEIEEAVLMLGYGVENTKVINTDDVYKEIGIDIYSEEYKDLDFNSNELSEVKKYME